MSKIVVIRGLLLYNIILNSNCFFHLTICKSSTEEDIEIRLCANDVVKRPNLAKKKVKIGLFKASDTEYTEDFNAYG